MKLLKKEKDKRYHGFYYTKRSYGNKGDLQRGCTFYGVQCIVLKTILFSVELRRSGFLRISHGKACRTWASKVKLFSFLQIGSLF